MSHGLQDIMGEAGRLRAECAYVLRQLDDLESLTQEVHHLSEHEHGEVMSLNSIYSRSVEENLQRAGIDLSNWYLALGDVINTRR
jgi:hypothetical protein